MIRSLVLFVHITGVLAMCAGMALETLGPRPAGQSASRTSGIGAALTVLSGFYLGARLGVLSDDWMRASYGGIVVMMAAGLMARQSDTRRRIALRARGVFGLAVVFLMISKPDAVASLVVLGLALGVSALVALPLGLAHSSGLSSNQA